MMKPRLPAPALWAAALAALLSSACATSQPAAPTPIAGPDPDEIAVVATTDFHASLERAEGLASVIRGLKARYGDQMIYLDGGDLFQGSLEGNMSKGRSIIDFYNLLGVDAAAIGNHELDYGPNEPGTVVPKRGEDGMGNLRARAKQAKFSWLSANIIRDRASPCRPSRGATIEHCNALGKRTVFPPHAIFQRAGKKICVIGATTPSTPAITRPEFIRGVRFTELKPVVEAEARHLREDEACDLVILVAHAGLVCKNFKDSGQHIDDGYCREGGDRAEILALLNALPAGTLDAVVAGHTHLLAQEAINGTPVVEAGAYAHEVGVLHLTGTHASGLRARFQPFVTVPETANEPDVTAILKPYREAAAEQRQRPVGSTTAAFTRTYGAENALGNLVADAILAAGREADGAQFALVNAGGIRADLPSGPINYGDVFHVVPFDNSLAVVEVRGAELRRILEIAFSGGHGMSPVAGLRIKRLNAPPGMKGGFSRDLNGDGKGEDWERNLLLEVTDEVGRPIEDEKRYKLATLDFLVSGGDHQAAAYDLIPAERKHIFLGIWARDVVTDFLRKHPRASPDAFYSPARPRIVNVPLN